MKKFEFNYIKRRLNQAYSAQDNLWHYDSIEDKNIKNALKSMSQEASQYTGNKKAFKFKLKRHLFSESGKIIIKSATFGLAQVCDLLYTLFNEYIEIFYRNIPLEWIIEYMDDHYGKDRLGESNE